MNTMAARHSDASGLQLFSILGALGNRRAIQVKMVTHMQFTRSNLVPL